MKKLLPYLAAGLVSIVFFLVFFGSACLNPSYTDYLYEGGLDISQHYIGWVFFRKSPWGTLPGLFDGLSYPNEISIIYMDSIPLLAVLFKLVRGVLPEQFQYFGLYQLLCFVLQGWFSVKLFKRFTEDPILLTLIAGIITAAPVFLWRVFLHIALSSHWIILLAFYGFFYFDEKFSGRYVKEALFYGLMGLLCTTVHLYFMPICFLIMVGTVIVQFRKGRLSTKDGIIPFVSFFAMLFASMYILGAFRGGANTGSGDIEWQRTFNLDGFFNPQHWSRVLPDLPLYSGRQAEGFAYLGLGILLMGAAAFILFLKNKGFRRDILKKPEVFGGIIICILSVIAALSPVITLGKWSVKLPIPFQIEKIWNIFRCCGRFIWPCFYLIVFSIAVILIRNIQNRKLLYLLLGACFLIQIFDISGRLKTYGETTDAATEFSSEYQEEAWDIIGRDESLVNLVNVNLSILDDIPSLADFADRYDKKIAKFYYARIFDFSNEYRSWSLENLPDSDLYRFDPEKIPRMWNTPGLSYYMMDGRVIAHNDDIKGLDKWRFDPKSVPYTYDCTEGSIEDDGGYIDDYVFLHPKGIYESGKTGLFKGEWEITLSGENFPWDKEDVLEHITLNCGDGVVRVSETGRQGVKFTVSLKEETDFSISVENSAEEEIVLYNINIFNIGG